MSRADFPRTEPASRRGRCRVLAAVSIATLLLACSNNDGVSQQDGSNGSMNNYSSTGGSGDTGGGGAGTTGGTAAMAGSSGSAGAAAGGAPAQRLSKPRPNIIFILADDMGWSDVGAYGSEIATPNLDELAHNGVRFTQFHNTSKCFPTRAALMTGVYAQQSGIGSSFSSPMHDVVTTGEVLRAAGYRTLMSGKHHSVDNPFDRGFDRSYGLLDGAMNYFNPGLQRDGEPPPAQKRDRTWMDDGLVFKTRDPAHQDYFPQGFYATDAFTDRALSYLDDYQDDEQPFFLYLAYTAPHDPMMAWPEDIAKYAGKYDVGFDVIRQARYAKMAAEGVIDPDVYQLSPSTFSNWDSLSASEKQNQARRMEVYAAMIDRLDQNIGRLLDRLKELDKFDNTLILFASDNGASAEVVNIGSGQIGNLDRWSSLLGNWANVSNSPFRFFKNYSHEGGTASPLIAHWPDGLAEPGRVSHLPLHLVDVMPTLVELGRGKYPRSFAGQPVTPQQGISFVPALDGIDIAARPELYWQWQSGGALRDGKWKLVKHNSVSGGDWQLFDILADPTELSDLAGQNSGVLDDMTARWTSWTTWSSRLDPPNAENDQFEVAAGASVDLDILANDAATGGSLDPGSVWLYQEPVHGSVQLDAATGALEYTQNGDAPAVDTMVYAVRDDAGDLSHWATVTVLTAHESIPLAVPDELAANTGSVTALDVLANDLDADDTLDGAVLTVTIPPMNGRVEVDGTTLMYTHDGGVSELDRLSYTVRDADGNVSNTATVYVTISN